MKNDKFDIKILIKDLTESEKICVYAFLMDLREGREPKESTDKA